MKPSRNSERLIILITGCLAVSQAFITNPFVYAIFQTGIYVLLGVALIAMLVDGTLRVNHPVIITLAIVIVGNVVVRAIVSILTGINYVGRDPLIAPLVLIVLGFSGGNSIDPRRIAVVYSSVALPSVWYVILTSGGSAVTGEYAIAQKNQLGAFVAAAFAICLWMLVSSLGSAGPERPWLPIFSGSVMVLSFTALLVLRNRSSLVGLLLLMAVVVVGQMGSKRTTAGVKVGIVVGVTIGYVLFGVQLRSLIDEALFSGYDIGDLNDVSANRFDVYLASLDYLRSNWLLGDIYVPSDLFDPHNFVLYHLVKFGMILSSGHLLVYGYCLFRLVSEWVSRGATGAKPWAYLLFVAMFGSLLEYAQPFGPGSTQFLTWLLVGKGLSQEVRP